MKSSRAIIRAELLNAYTVIASDHAEGMPSTWREAIQLIFFSLSWIATSASCRRHASHDAFLAMTATLRCYLCICLIFLCNTAFAFEAETTLPIKEQEIRAQLLFKQFKCMVCAGESVAESQADLAKAMREVIRMQVKAGKSDSEISEFLASRYGVNVLMNPPFLPQTLLLWLSPLLVLSVGLLIILRIPRR